ncbi:MAG: cobalamin-binding protein [Planctomycetes bacterium]|nr:cobalamin-binding protein [Planctomycetota bacterium]
MTSDLRIASLLASGTEIIDRLGLGERLVAISHECDYPPKLMNRPRVTRAIIDTEASSEAIDRQVAQLISAGASLYRVDADALASLRPNVIVTQSQCDVCAVSLSDVAAVVRKTPELANAQIVPLNPTNFDGVLDDIRAIGTATGAALQADCLVEAMRSRIARVRHGTADLPAIERPRVVCIEWLKPLIVAANWMPEMIEYAGGCPVLSQGGERSRTTHWDELHACKPDVVVIMPCGFDLERILSEWLNVSQEPDWMTLAKSVERIYAVDGNAYFNRSGPRLVDSLEILASLIHPDRFPPRLHDEGTVWRQLC